MQRKTWLTLLVVAFMVGGVSTACKKDQPEPPQPVDPVEEAMEDPIDVVEEDLSTEGDIEVTPLDGELIEANRYAHETGLLGDVYFDLDRSDLSSSSRDRLSQNAEFIASRPEFTFTIEGHCDERGTNEYNLALGDRRSNTALSYLVSLGVDASRITTISYGEESPACTSSGESCWSQNRRAHFAITGRR